MLYDISQPVHEGTPVWPGDATYRLSWTMRRSEGASVNVAELCLSAHTGTHADGPFHAADEGVRIGAAPLEAYLGPATVVEAAGREMIEEEWVQQVLSSTSPERLLLRTGCWTDPDVFPQRFAAIAPAAAARLVEAGVRLVGTDAPSVDPFDSKQLPTHRVLGEGRVAILENLLLEGVPEGRYELIALPLRLEESDSSPVRAVLRTL